MAPQHFPERATILPHFIPWPPRKALARVDGVFEDADAALVGVPHIDDDGLRVPH